MWAPGPFTISWLVEDVLASRFAGPLIVVGVHGGASPAAERPAHYHSLYLDSRKALARQVAGIAG